MGSKSFLLTILGATLFAFDDQYQTSDGAHFILQWVLTVLAFLLLRMKGFLITKALT